MILFFSFYFFKFVEYSLRYTLCFFFMQDVRQFGKSILEQVSDTRGLSCGLKFLCSYKPSLYATILGLKHAMKLVIFSANVS